MRYLGSKERIADDIVSILSDTMENKQITTFIDGFCGGCSISQRIPDTYTRIANDNNRYLIAMWRKLTASTWQPPINIPKTLYDKARVSYNKKDGKMDDALIGWIGFMASRNGRFFDGGYSGHCVGNECRDYIAQGIRNITRQIRFLQGIIWCTGSFDTITAPESSLLYYDPPYRGTTGYNTSRGFDHDYFYDYCRQMKRDGHIVFISEYTMPSDFSCIWQKQINNTVNTTKTTKPIERLWTIN